MESPGEEDRVSALEARIEALEYYLDLILDLLIEEEPNGEMRDVPEESQEV